MHIMDRIYKHWTRGTTILGLILFSTLFLLNGKIDPVNWFLWLNLSIYALHQFEEFILPGGFKQELESQVRGTVSDRAIFFINIIYIWIALPVFFLLRSVSPIFPVSILFTVLINALLHIVTAIRQKHYNPGLIVSVILTLPVASYTILLFNSMMTVYGFVLSFIIGFILHATLFVYLFIFPRKRKHV
jgi:hypothetical protein